MQERYATFFNPVAYTGYTHPGPTTATVNAASALTHAATNSGFIQMKYVNRIPHRGICLIANFPSAITCTGAGTTGTTLTPTITFSDDGTNAVAGLSHVGQPLSLTFASTACTALAVGSATVTPLSGFVLYFRLPQVNHKYAKLAWATVLGTTITAVAYGVVGAVLESLPDSLANNAYDIG